MLLFKQTPEQIVNEQKQVDKKVQVKFKKR